MMGPRQVDQAARFYEFSLERHVPATRLLRSIDRFVDLSDVRSHLAPFYSSTGRPSIDPELLVRILLVGYCYGVSMACFVDRNYRILFFAVTLNLSGPDLSPRLVFRSIFTAYPQGCIRGLGERPHRLAAHPFTGRKNPPGVNRRA